MQKYDKKTDMAIASSNHLISLAHLISKFYYLESSDIIEIDNNGKVKINNKENNIIVKKYKKNGFIAVYEIQ
jgi:phosphosulfolactate synthase (CoM biosynthesis protein A)